MRWGRQLWKNLMGTINKKVMEDIAIYGAGGFGREVACQIQIINEIEKKWRFIGYFDDGVLKGSHLEYGDVLGGITTVNSWSSKLNIVIAIGSTENLYNIYSNITNPNICFPNIVFPDTIYFDKQDLIIGNGNVICPRCLISTRVKIGNFNIFNGYIPIGHDVTIGDFNVIMPCVNISGAVTIGDRNFFGLKSAVLQGVKIGNDTRIAAGSVVIRNTLDGLLYHGNPATKMKI